MDQKIVDAAFDFAKRIDVPASYLLAFVVVESSGQALWPVGKQRLPAIRIEGHYFFKLLSGKKRDEAVRLGLAAKKAGVIKNPKDYQGRYAMLERMKEIDEEIAYQSISIGLGQVMGANWKAAGCLSAVHMFTQACQGAYNQVGHMANFINDNAKLKAALKRGDWRTVELIYNGPAAKGYAAKFQAALKNIMLEPYGGKVVDLDDRKERILALGYSDVKAFQKEQGLKVDGIIGNATTDALIEVEAARKGQVNAKRNSALKLGFTAVGGTVPVLASTESGLDLDRIGQYVDLAQRMAGFDLRYILAAGAVAGVGALAVAGWEWWKNRAR